MAIDNPSNLMPDQEIIIEGDVGFVPKASPSDAGKVLGVLNASGDVGWVVDQSGTFIQVQADWAETDSSQPSYIDHKPDLSVYATASSVETALAGKQDTISDLSEIRAGAAKGDTAVQPSALATVATSGNYNDLTGKPDLSIYAESSDLATVATTGSYNDLSNKPTIPAAQVNSDWNASSGVSEILNKPNLATVATTGDYSDLTNKPSIPAAQVNSDWNASSGVAVILNKPDLSAYATDSELTSGLATKQNIISDLDTIRAGAAAGATAAQPSDLPSSDELVPSSTSVDAGKVLTVGNDGTASWITPSAGTVYTPGDGVDITNDVISADVDGVTIGIDSTTKKIKSLQTIPSKTSDLTNDSNFVVASSLATVATSGSYADLSNKPNIPAAQVQSDYAQSNSSAVDYIKNKPDLSVYAQSANLATVATSGNYSDLSGKPTIPSVDQTYNASSTNAQSGTAVAQAIASIPSSSYTAGDGIDITSGEISVGIANTLDFAPKTTTTTYTVTPEDYLGYISLPQEFGSIVASSTAELTIHFPQNSFYVYSTPTKPIRVGVTNDSTWLASSEVSLTYHMEGSICYLDEQTVTISCPANDWEYVTGSTMSSASKLLVIPVDSNGWGGALNTNTGVGSIDFTLVQSDPDKTVVTVKNPLPASAQADSGKVLKVNAAGNAEWGTDGFTTTAGITDIQVVNSLPASPVATVLYLLPEA